MKRCPFCNGRFIVMLAHPDSKDDIGHCATEGCILGHGLISLRDWEKRAESDVEVDHA